MKDLSLHIENLLLDHDCVIYPQLGAFTTTYVPSKWSEEEDLFLPPYRMVSFDAEVKDGDELFITTLSKRYRVNKTDASVMCAEYLDYIRQELDENGTMDLGSIGVFVQEDENSPLLFYPTPSGVATPELYGLDAVHMLPLSEPQTETTKKLSHISLLPTVENDDSHLTIRISKQFAGYVATAAACIVMFFAFSTPAENTSMSPMQSAKSEFFMPSNLIPSLADAPSAPAESVEKAEMENTPANEVQPVQTGNYAIVLASAVSMNNAKSFVENLRAEGYQAEVYVKGSMVRVIIPGFASADAGQSKINQMKAQNRKYSKAWVMQIK